MEQQYNTTVQNIRDNISVPRRIAANDDDGPSSANGPGRSFQNPQASSSRNSRALIGISTAPPFDVHAPKQAPRVSEELMNQIKNTNRFGRVRAAIASVTEDPVKFAEVQRGIKKWQNSLQRNAPSATTSDREPLVAGEARRADEVYREYRDKPQENGHFISHDNYMPLADTSRRFEINIPADPKHEMREVCGLFIRRSLFSFQQEDVVWKCPRCSKCLHDQHRINDSFSARSQLEEHL